MIGLLLLATLETVNSQDSGLFYYLITTTILARTVSTNMNAAVPRRIS
jgi:hypothetical protein